MSRLPIAFTYTPVSGPVRALDINQLLALIASQLVGEVDSAFAGLSQLDFIPTVRQGLIFHTPSQLFYVWDDTAGKYVPLTQPLAFGDVKLSFVAGDEPAEGFVVLDGRTISGIAGLASYQLSALTSLFGTTLPNLLPLGGAYYKVFCGYL